MKVIIDKHHLYKTTRSDFVVADQQGYQKARGLLFRFLMEGTADFDNLHVFQFPYIEWFDDIPELVEPVTPRTTLLNRHPGLQLVEKLTDDDIYDLGLLDLQILPTEKNIFRHFFGIELPVDTVTIQSLYTLSQCLLEKKTAFENNYLKDLWQSTLAGLVSADVPILNELLDPLIRLDKEHAEIMSEGVYCCKNIPYLERWLHEHTRYFHGLGVVIKAIEHILQVSQPVQLTNPRLEKNIYRFVISRADNGDKYMAAISGYYPAEADALIFLKPRLLLEDYQQLSEKFAGRLTYAQQQGIFRLCSPEYVPPPAFVAESIKDQMEAWQRWGIESFIPYKFYYDEITEPVESVMQNIQTGSVAYSDWLFTNYRAIINNNNILTNFDVPTMIRAQMDDPEHKVIWLILDGFPAYYTPALRGILQKNGLNKIDLEWSMATLPTITSLGIPLMLSGAYESGSSPELLQDRQAILHNLFTGRSCSYTSKLSDFQKALALDTDLCCLHTHEIDDMLHQIDSMFDTSRADKVEEILGKRIRMISDMIKETPEKKIKLVISTDHGATKCLNKGQNIKNIRLDEAMKDNQRERCVALKGSMDNEQFDPNEMYLLTKETSQNRDDWAIAKGYKYFGRHDTGYRHGGLSPEETIVPVIWCEIRPSTEAQIQVRYIGIRDLKFGKTERDFKLKVRNSGNTTIELREFTVLADKNCIFTMPVTIAPGADTTLHAAIKLPQKLQTNAKGGKLDLDLTITCLILGDSVSQSLKCTVMTEKDDFEDDFDF